MAEENKPEEAAKQEKVVATQEPEKKPTITMVDLTNEEEDSSSAPKRSGRDTRRGARAEMSRGGDGRGEESGDIEKIVFINRCAKVVKGGRRFSFSALLVSGDGGGKVGVGFGKANEVSEAIRKAGENARKQQEKVALHGTSIPHQVEGKFGGARVLLKPASKGTGLIAGGGVRAVVEAAGIQDVLGKSLGSANPSNVVKATVDALQQLRLKEDIFRVRGKRPVSDKK